MLSLLILTIVVLPCTASTQECKEGEFKCFKTPKSTARCVPISYKCDNVPDCDGSDAADETDCPLPGQIEDLQPKVYVDDLKGSELTWSTEGSKFTNVSVEISYLDSATKKMESKMVYGRVKECYDYDGPWCAKMQRRRIRWCDGYMVKFIIFCRRFCGVCRIDSVRNNARFDMLTLLETGAINITARAYASNYKGNGPKTTSVRIPIPEITGVKNLTVKINNKGNDSVWATVAWNTTSHFIPNHYIIASDTSIEYKLLVCRVFATNSGVYTEECYPGIIEHPCRCRKEFYDLKYGSRYSFRVTPVSRHTDAITGPSESVSLILPPKEERTRTNNLAISFGVAGGGVVCFVLVFMAWRRYNNSTYYF